VTASIVTLSAFGAIVMYIASMLSLFRLRRCEPDLERPFAAPLADLLFFTLPKNTLSIEFPLTRCAVRE
jgi:amino acid transporter